MKVTNFTSHNGNSIANQFIIRTSEKTVFQSYNSVIIEKDLNTGKITLDEYYWDYSKTTGKYRNMFLDEKKSETQKKIDLGIYKLANLN